MNNAELNQYLDTMSNHARAFAFCEGWSPPAERLDFRVRRPETVPEEKPYCGADGPPIITTILPSLSGVAIELHPPASRLRAQVIIVSSCLPFGPPE